MPAPRDAMSSPAFASGPATDSGRPARSVSASVSGWRARPAAPPSAPAAPVFIASSLPVAGIMPLPNCVMYFSAVLAASGAVCAKRAMAWAAFGLCARARMPPAALPSAGTAVADSSMPFSQSGIGSDSWAGGTMAWVAGVWPGIWPAGPTGAARPAGCASGVNPPDAWAGGASAPDADGSGTNGISAKSRARH